MHHKASSPQSAHKVHAMPKAAVARACSSDSGKLAAVAPKVYGNNEKHNQLLLALKAVLPRRHLRFRGPSQQVFHTVASFSHHFLRPNLPPTTSYFIRCPPDSISSSRTPDSYAVSSERYCQAWRPALHKIYDQQTQSQIQGFPNIHKPPACWRPDMIQEQ